MSDSTEFVWSVLISGLELALHVLIFVSLGIIVVQFGRFFGRPLGRLIPVPANSSASSSSSQERGASDTTSTNREIDPAHVAIRFNEKQLGAIVTGVLCYITTAVEFVRLFRQKPNAEGVTVWDFEATLVKACLGGMFASAVLSAVVICLRRFGVLAS